MLNDNISVPTGAQIQGNDGNFYVPTNAGVISVTPAGTATGFFEFAADCGGDAIGLIQLADGSFYATADGGGAHQGGCTFTISPQGVGTTLYSFYHSVGLPGAPVQGSDHDFYVSTDSFIYGITPTGVATIVYAFDTPQNAPPIIRGADGNLYVTTQFGGPHGAGALLKIAPP